MNGFIANGLMFYCSTQWLNSSTVHARMTLFPIDKVGNMFESKKRSIAKAASYRFFGSMVTASIAYFLTSKWEVALGIGLVDGVAKMAGYFLHERVWAHIKWGAPKRPDYEI